MEWSPPSFSTSCSSRADNPLVSTLLTWTTYAVGFAARPIGAIIFGHYGDRIGRKTILVLTLVIMGASTFVIGLLPTYQSVGVWAPISLLVLRVLQGIGIGGEWGGAVLLSIEHAPKGRRGFFGSWPQIGVPAGLCTSAGVVGLLSYMPEQAFLDYGWRIAFLLSVVLVAVGIYVRMSLMETPAFLRVKETKTVAAVPFTELWRNHGKNVILGMGARYIEGVVFNTYGVYVISYLVGNRHLARGPVLLGVTLAAFLMIFFIPLFGALSDRVGRRLMFGVAAIIAGIVVFPAFGIMAATDSMPWIWIAILIPFAIIYPAIYGPQAALFSELFDTRVRFSGVSFVYHFSGIFSSGLTPLIMTWLLAEGGGQPWLICIYVAIVSLISAVAVYAMPAVQNRDVETDDVPVMALANVGS